MISSHHAILLIVFLLNFIIMVFAIKEVIQSSFSAVKKIVLILISIVFLF